MKLNNWSVVYLADNPYQAPELQAPRLRGNVYDNPKFEDGDLITTSPIVSYNSETCCIVTASGSEYFLLDVDPDYNKAYPNAYARLIFSLKEKEDKKPENWCHHCDEREGTRYTNDPYVEDIFNRITEKSWWCDICYRNSCDDI